MAFGTLIALAVVAAPPTLLRDTVPGPSTIPVRAVALTEDLWLTGGPLDYRLWRFDPARLDAAPIRDIGGDGTAVVTVPLDGVTVLLSRLALDGRTVVRTLGRTDGTPLGTFAIGTQSASPVYLAALGDGAYVLSVRDGQSLALERTDGLTMSPVAEWSAGGARIGYGRLSTASSAMWFAVQTASTAGVFRSDGTSSGTSFVLPVADASTLQPAAELGTQTLLVVDGALYAIRAGAEPQRLIESGSVDAPVAAADGQEAWVARRVVNNLELWRTDGTAEGTARAFSVRMPGPSYRRGPFVVGDAVFVADSTHNIVGWTERTGTVTATACETFAPTRTALLCTHRTDDGGGVLFRVDAVTLDYARLDEGLEPPSLQPRANGDTLVAWAETGDAGARVDVYDSDGRLARSAHPFEGPPPPRYYIPTLVAELADETLLLEERRHGVRSRLDLTTGREVWRAPGGGFVSADASGFFSVRTDGLRGTQLFRFDTSAGEDRLVRAWSSRAFDEARRAGESVVFSVEENYVPKWWVSDGTLDGTRRLLDSSNVTAVVTKDDGTIELLVPVGDRVELRRRTEDGFETIYDGARPDVAIHALVATKERRYVVGTAYQTDTRTRRLRIDAFDLERGETEVRYEGPPHASSGPPTLIADRFVLYDGEAVAITDEGVESIPLVGVREIVPFEDGALLSGFREDIGVELWRWRPGETVELVSDIAEGRASSVPTALVASGDLAVFSAWHPELGYELFVTDGSADGTWPASDIAPGRFDGVHRNSTIALGPRYVSFYGMDRAHGAEPWRVARDELARVTPPAPLDPPNALADTGCGCEVERGRAPRGWLALLFACAWLARPRSRRGRLNQLTLDS